MIKDDVEEGDLNRPEMTAKLIAILETAMYEAMKKGQYSAVAANAKVLMRLIGLAAIRCRSPQKVRSRHNGEKSKKILRYRSEHLRHFRQKCSLFFNARKHKPQPSGCGYYDPAH